MHAPEAPEAPEAPDAPDAPEAPEAPDAPEALEAPEAPDARKRQASASSSPDVFSGRSSAPPAGPPPCVSCQRAQPPMADMLRAGWTKPSSPT
jgi:hypothetical protein